MKAYYAPDDAVSEDVRAFDNYVTGGEIAKIYLASEVEAVLRKIMTAAAGVSEFHTKEFHRECLNSVRTIAHLALEG